MFKFFPLIMISPRFQQNIIIIPNLKFDSKSCINSPCCNPYRVHSSLVHTFAYKISHINIHSQRRIALHNINHKYILHSMDPQLDRFTPQSGPKKAKLWWDGTVAVLAQNLLPSFLFEFPSACYATNPRTGLALPNIRGMLSLYTFPTPGMASSF